MLGELVPGNVTPQALEAILYDAAIKTVGTPKRSAKTSSALAVIGLPSPVDQLGPDLQEGDSCDQ